MVVDHILEVVFRLPLRSSGSHMRALHHEGVDVSWTDLRHQAPNHPRLPAMQPQITRIEKRFSISLKQVGHAAKTGMVDRQRRDRETAHLKRLSRYHPCMPVAIERLLPSEESGCQHHLAGATGGVDRDFWFCQVQEPGMIEMAVREQDRSRRCAIIKQARHPRHDTVGDQFLKRLLANHA